MNSNPGKEQKYAGHGDPITPEDIEALRGGDVRAYDKIFRAFNQPLVNVMKKMTGSFEDAEDIVQNTFITLWETREKLDPARKINTYLFTVAKRAVVDYFRRRKVAGDYLGSMDWDGIGGETSDSLVIEKEIELFRDVAISLMPEYRRKIYQLSYGEGLSNDEVAQRLGVSKETVYTEKSKARKQLSELAKYLMILLLLQ